MIAHVKGLLEESDFNTAVVDVQGVGYSLSIPISTFERLPRPGSPVALFVHMAVREDAIELFGFATAVERRLFKLLIDHVNGVGPRLALAVLSAMPAVPFCQALQGGDIKTLSKINGIGKKTAERMIVELKDKVSDFLYGSTGSVGTGTADPAAGLSPDEAAAVRDAVLALETLGFRPDKVRKVVQDLHAQLQPGERSSEVLIRRALGQLNTVN